MKKIVSTSLATLLAMSAFTATAINPIAAENDANSNIVYQEEIVLQNDSTSSATFDEDNIILRFGVVSDIHQSGSYAGSVNDPQIQEWVHTIDVLQQTAKDSGGVLDAILINGDMVDAIANGSSNLLSFNSYGDRATQNMREVANFARGVWGSDNGVTFTSDKKVINPAKKNKAEAYMTAGSVAGIGNGFDDTTKLFYVLGNHDESARGVSNSHWKSIDGTNTNFPAVYSADLFAAILCGWQHNPDNTNKDAGGYDKSNPYRNYIADLIDYNTNASTTVTANSFATAYGVTLDSADALFDKYFGHLDKETTLTDNNDGLRFGNMHMVIGGIHFIGIELSQNAASIAWAKEILDKSVAEDPTKPVFIISHYTPAGTMYGDSSKTALGDLLKDYPQAVSFGGHSHTTLHNDNAINSEFGYVAIETNTTRYLNTKESLTLTSMFGEGNPNNSDNLPHTAYNYPEKNDDTVSNACYIEVDKNYNVRIRRMDLYRSYSKDYEESPSVYTSGNFVSFDNSQNNEFVAVDAPVFIREPWILSGFETGEYIDDFSTSARKAATAKPYFENAADSLAAQGTIEGLSVTFKTNAKDDGMVMLYVLELYDPDNDNSLVERRYFTNFYYQYPQDPTANFAGNNIPVTTETTTFSGLPANKDYTVKLFAVDDFYVAGESITTNVTTKEGATTVTLSDGRIAACVDTSGATTEYTLNGAVCVVYNTFADAINTGADVLYVISCPYTSNNLRTDILPNQIKDLEIIGVTRSNATLSWTGEAKLENFDLTLTNLTVSNKKSDGSAASIIAMNGNTLTFNDCVIPEDGTNIIIFTGLRPLKDVGTTYPSGNVKITGNDLSVGDVFASGTYCSDMDATIDGDVTLTLDGGIYNKAVVDMKVSKNAIIDGNLYINVTGGNFKAGLRASVNNAKAIINKNSVLTVTGGTISALGNNGTSYVKGKEIYITTTSVLSGTTYTASKDASGNNKSILIVVPNDYTDVLGAPTYDANGYITGYNLNKIAGMITKVNGNEFAGNVLTIEEGKNYTITYEFPEGYNKVDFIINIPVAEPTQDSPVYPVEYEDGSTYDNRTLITFISKDGSDPIEVKAEGNSINSFAVIPMGEYTVEITKNGYLKYTGEATLDDSGLVLPEVELIAGDIKGSYANNCGDGIIDSDDFVRVLRGFANNASDKLKHAVDINEDGEVNVEDLMLIKNNLRKTSASYNTNN